MYLSCVEAADNLSKATLGFQCASVCSIGRLFEFISVILAQVCGAGEWVFVHLKHAIHWSKACTLEETCLKCAAILRQGRLYQVCMRKILITPSVHS